MENLSKLINSFDFKGIQFVAINGYKAESGEISNFLINVGGSIQDAKKRDLNKLLSLNDNDLFKIALKYGFSIADIQICYNELIKSLRQNLNENLQERTNSSKGQTLAYDKIGNGIKFNENQTMLYIYGFQVNKTILVTGTNYKSVKIGGKTDIKGKINIFANTTKYKNFRLDRIQKISVNKNTLIIEL